MEGTGNQGHFTIPNDGKSVYSGREKLDRDSTGKKKQQTVSCDTMQSMKET